MGYARNVAVDSLSLIAAEQALAAFKHDVFHLPAYSAAIAAEEGGAPIWLQARGTTGAVMLCLFLRPTADLPGAYDATNGYGYPGLLCRPEPGCRPEAVLAECLPAVEAHLCELGAVSLFLRSHPYLGPDASALPSGYEVVTHGDIVALSPRLGVEGMWREIRRGHRRTLDQLSQEGFRFEQDLDWAALDTFEAIYAETMRRRSASGHYFFSNAYFSALRDALGDKIKMFVVRHGKEIAAAGLYLFHGQFAHAHLTATARPFLSAAPSKLLFWGAAKEAAKLDIECFNLGGGVGGAADSLFTFKAGFSPRRASFYTVRRVLNPTALADLMAHWRVKHPNCTPQPGTFPPHRAAPEATQPELRTG